MALAPKPLSLSSLPSLSSFSTPHLFQFRNPQLVHFRSLFSPIICKSTRTDAAADYPLSAPELDGAGAAAPTRGDVFLQTHQSSAASSAALAEIKKKKKKNKDKAAKSSSSFNGPSCYGCGAPLQTSVADAPGYVEPEMYSLVS